MLEIAPGTGMLRQRHHRSSMKLFLSSTLLLLLATASRAAGFDPAHAAFGQVLAARVTNGVVDYAALKAAPTGLADYLGALAAVPEAEFKTWTEPARLAFLLNLYNATTLKLIADHHPVSSIKQIGGLIKGPWKQEVVRAWGRVFTLDELEHKIIRAKYPDPRAHFAMVCAAKSCPPLRSEPYTGDKLAAQLDDQARVFLAQTAKNRVDAAANTLWLSPIFKWFGEDFTAGGKTVPEFVAPFLPEAAAKQVRAGGLKLRFTDYDWSLNGK